VSSSKGTKIQIRHGVDLLTALSWVDEQIQDGKYSKKKARKHRRRITSELQSLLFRMKYSVYNKSWEDYLLRKRSAYLLKTQG